MPAESLVRAAAHRVKPLVIRGGLARTFGSLVKASWRCSSCSPVSTFSVMPSNIRWMRKPLESSRQLSASRWRPSFSISFSSPATASAHELLASGARNSRKVSLLENLPVVPLVPRGDESQGSHAHLVLVRRASQQPRFFPQRAK